MVGFTQSDHKLPNLLPFLILKQTWKILDSNLRKNYLDLPIFGGNGNFVVVRQLVRK